MPCEVRLELRDGTIGADRAEPDVGSLGERSHMKRTALDLLERDIVNDESLADV